MLSQHQNQGEIGITINHTSKQFQICFDGKFSDPKGGEAFVKEFQNKLATINPSEYTLVIDVSKMMVFEQDAIEQVKDIFVFYESCHFKLIRFVTGTAPIIIKMQMKRIARAANLSNYEIVES